MSIIYSDVERQQSLEKEPYTILTKRYRGIKKDLDGQEIVLPLFSGKDGFFKGFYTDREYTNNASLCFFFSKEKSKNDESSSFFVRMKYSFDCDEHNYWYYKRHTDLLRKRVPYFYIPFASNFEFSHNVDDRFNMMFDIIVETEENVLQACYCLLNLIIAIFSFED